MTTCEWSGADVIMIFTADAATLRPYGAAVTVCCVQVQEGNCCMLGPGHIIPGNLASSKLLSQFLHALNFFGNKKQPQHPRPIGILFSLNLMIKKQDVTTVDGPRLARSYWNVKYSLWAAWATNVLPVVTELPHLLSPGAHCSSDQTSLYWRG